MEPWGPEEAFAAAAAAAAADFAFSSFSFFDFLDEKRPAMAGGGRGETEES